MYIFIHFASKKSEEQNDIYKLMFQKQKLNLFSLSPEIMFLPTIHTIPYNLFISEEFVPKYNHLGIQSNIYFITFYADINISYKIYFGGIYFMYVRNQNRRVVVFID